MGDVKLQALVQEAHRSGASDVAIISADDILVEETLADKCREPRCENYGMSKSCPPHVLGPSFFRKQLETFSKGIFFKIEVPSEILYSSQGLECFRLLHEIAAGIEQSAKNTGFINAQAYAGGPCKKIFCHDHTDCLALSEKKKCRYPHLARPSMSGFGINVATLFELAGWTMKSNSHDPGSAAKTMTNICALVLIH